MIRSVYDVASIIAKYRYRLSVTNIELRDATRKSGETEKERGRGRHLSSGDLRNGSCTLDRMRVSLRASARSRCGAVVLGTCS